MGDLRVKVTLKEAAMVVEKIFDHLPRGVNLAIHLHPHATKELHRGRQVTCITLLLVKQLLRQREKNVGVALK